MEVLEKFRSTKWCLTRTFWCQASATPTWRSSWATCSRVPTWFRSCFDDGRVCAILTNDERIPEVAPQSGAMIVTHNTKDFAGLGVAVRTPAEFLKILRESV